MTPEAQTWLAAGRAIALPDHMAMAFERYVNALPWFTSSLDWSRMPPCADVNLQGDPSPDYRPWLPRTRLSLHTHLAVWYPGHPRSSGIVAPMLDALDELDALYWPAPGSHFCFGMDVSRGKLRPAYKDLLEYTFNQHYISVALGTPARTAASDRAG